ncbi:hypothetical protein CCR75_004605 [Bremia lactucae]|uniref:Uncharacterized protein n=1 Tax=Bremia lactucae TaxID=4779 RepID=A0A976IM88_BRELC|nr:hypothetical protein CCR75_004605 [Bremia lactucae]
MKVEFFRDECILSKGDHVDTTGFRRGMLMILNVEATPNATQLWARLSCGIVDSGKHLSRK